MRPAAEGDRGRSRTSFKTLLSARRCLTRAQLTKVSRLSNVEPTHLALREPLKNTAAQNEIIEQMIKRYSITYVPNRGVSLFDIVGFSLLSPFEQMMQLNSLSYSLNSAQAKLLTKRIGVDFSRTTTGDGFYIWNRNLTPRRQRQPLSLHAARARRQCDRAQEGGAQHGAEAARELPCRQQLRVPPSRRAQSDDLQLHRRRRHGRARADDRARTAGADPRRRFPRDDAGRRPGVELRDARLGRVRRHGDAVRSDSSRASSSPASASTRSAAISPGRSSTTANSRCAGSSSATSTGSRGASTTRRSTSTGTTPSRSCSASKIACSSPYGAAAGRASCAPRTPDEPGLARRRGRARVARARGRRLQRRLGFRLRERRGAASPLRMSLAGPEKRSWW